MENAAYKESEQNKLKSSHAILTAFRQDSRYLRAMALITVGAMTVLSLLIYFSNLTKNSDVPDVKLLLKSKPNLKFQSSDKYVRKEMRYLNSTELANYFAAVWALKTTGRQDGRGYLERYDDFVAHHMIATSNGTVNQAHEYAAFAIWHSLLVMEFEIALRSIDPSVSVPYWDWTIDEQLDDPSSSEIFSDVYFGSANASNMYIVDSGPLAYFPVSDAPLEYVSWESPYGFLRDSINYNPAPFVSRMIGVDGGLASTADVDACLAKQNFSAFWICEWGKYGSEADASTMHAGVHFFVGGANTNDDGTEWDGDMVDFYSSPNDPIWWSHHASLDRIWAKWREAVGTSLMTEDDQCGGFYVGETVNPQPAGHNLYEKFSPAFYAFRTVDEISTLGGLTLNEACYYFNADRLPYFYDN